MKPKTRILHGNKDHSPDEKCEWCEKVKGDWKEIEDTDEYIALFQILNLFAETVWAVKGDVGKYRSEIDTSIKAILMYLASQKTEILDEVINLIKGRTKNIEETYLITEHKEGHDESYPIRDFLDSIIKLLTEMRNTK